MNGWLRRTGLWHGRTQSSPATDLRFTTLDALRGVAALLVVWFHISGEGWSAGPKRGYLAVDLFFALSGFVLAYRYDQRFRDGLGAIDFLKARFVRLYPLFVIGLVCGAALSLKRLLNDETSPSNFLVTWVSNVLMLPVPLFNGEQRLFPPDTAAWSLFFELFVANLSFAVLWRHLHGKALMALIAAGVVGVTLAAVYYGSADGGSKWSTATLGFTRVVFSFYAGVFLARLHSARRPQLVLPSWIFPVVLVAVLWVPVPQTAIVPADLISIFLILPAMVRWGATAVERNPKIGRTAGDVSYALYTIHLPLFLLCIPVLQHFGVTPRTPHALAFTIGCVVVAFGLDKLYDPPARRALGRLLRTRRTVSTTRPKIHLARGLAAIAAVSLLGASAVYWVHRYLAPKSFAAVAGRAVCNGSDGYEHGPSGVRTYLLRSDFLAKLRADPAVRQSEELAQLIRAADAALGHSSPAVTDKRTTPPSGDRHDYMSLSTYSWPDPAHPGQALWRDGVPNPKIFGPDYDFGRLRQTIDDAEVLGLAYYYTGDRRYAAKLAVNARRWFVDPATRMNPNLIYAQADAAGKIDNGNGTIDSWRLIFLVDALGLVDRSGEITASDRAALKQWFREYLSWLQSSAQGKHEDAAKNNHADFFDTQRIVYALYTGQPQLAKSLSLRSTERRLRQIRPWGALPAEEHRAKPAHYIPVTMNAFADLASVSECSGVDMWRSHGFLSGGMSKMYDRAAYYTEGRKWPGGTAPENPEPLWESFTKAAWAYRDPRLGAIAESTSTPDFATDSDYRWGKLKTPSYPQS